MITVRHNVFLEKNFILFPEITFPSIYTMLPLLCVYSFVFEIANTGQKWKEAEVDKEKVMRRWW